MSIYRMAIAAGLKPSTVYARIRRGMDPIEALRKPARLYFYEWRN